MGARKQNLRFPARSTVRSENESRSGLLVFAPRDRPLAKRIGASAICSCRIQRRREPRTALGRSEWRDGQRISRSHRFPGDAKLRAIDPQSFRVLQKTRANVKELGELATDF